MRKKTLVGFWQKFALYTVDRSLLFIFWTLKRDCLAFEIEDPFRVLPSLRNTISHYFPPLHLPSPQQPKK